MAISVVLIVICVYGGSYGQELFNIDNEMCCNKHIFPKSVDLDKNLIPVCCGDTSINLREELCCGNKTVKLPSEALINADASTSMISLPGAHRRFGLPYINFPHYSCCGDSYYNFDTDLCCDDKIVHKPPTDGVEDSLMSTYWACCGAQLLNVSSQDCCRGKVMDRGSVTESCCGDRIIDNAKEICCFDDFLDDNEEPTVLPRDHLDVGCCGRNRIDYKKEICCMNKVVPLPDDINERGITVCCGENLWTSASDEICCDGKVIKQSGLMSCCDKQTYNFDTHVCCDETIQPKATNSTFCCGKTTYDEMKDQACCYGTGAVIPIVDPEKRFCCE